MNREILDNTLAAMYSNPKFASSYLFYGYLIAQCSIKIDTHMNSPAGVSYDLDHYNLYINPLYFDKYTLVERLCILKHEMLHILYKHVQRKKDRNHKTWNYATDCALNQDCDINHLPKGAILPELLSEKYGIDFPKRESAEVYYDILINIEPDDLPLMNSHDFWDKPGEEYIKKDVTSRMIKKAQEETIKKIGDSPVKCSDWLKLHQNVSQISWKKVIRNIVSNKKANKRRTIMKLNRRFPDREDLKGYVKDRTFELLVIVDVSASMSNKCISSTLSEVHNICKLTKSDVNLIQIDTIAYEPEKLSKNTKTITRKGNGGTYLTPALNKAKECRLDYQAIIILTDGGVLTKDIESFRKTNKKIIWLVSKDGKIHKNMNFGKMQAFKLNY